MNVIEQYLDEKQVDSAILLNGKWGSGKTYYYKNTIKELIVKKNLIPIYISVYGEYSTKELKNKIVSSYLIEMTKSSEFLKEKVEKLNKRVSKRLEKLKDYGINSSELISTIYENGMSQVVENIYKKIKEALGVDLQLSDLFSEFQNIVLVIDDFERTRIDIIELMGAIYKLIEEENIKTLIIANEAEIETSLRGKNQLNISTAFNFYKYVDDKINISNSKGDRSENNIKTVDTILKDVKKLTNKLYNDDFFYKKMKEKLISHTIVVNHNKESVAKKIFDDIINRDHAIAGIRKNVIKAFLLSEYDNLRVFKRSLTAIKYFICTLDENKINYAERNFRAIESMAIMMCLQYIESKIDMANDNELPIFETQNINHIYTDDGSCPESVININKKYKRVIGSRSEFIFYKSAQLWIDSYVFNKKLFLQDFSFLKSSNAPIETDNNPIGALLRDFRQMSYEKANTYVDEFLLNLKRGDYGLEDYKKALYYLVNLSKNRIIELRVSDIYRIFENNINNININYERDYLYGYSIDGKNEDNDYLRIINKADEAIEDKTLKTFKEQLNDYLDCWEEGVRNDFIELYSLYENDMTKEFFRFIEPKKLYDIAIKIPNNRNYYFFQFMYDRAKYSRKTPKEKENYDIFVSLIEKNIDDKNGLFYFHAKWFIDNKYKANIIDLTSD